MATIASAPGRVPGLVAGPVIEFSEFGQDLFYRRLAQRQTNQPIGHAESAFSPPSVPDLSFGTLAISRINETARGRRTALAFGGGMVHLARRPHQNLSLDWYERDGVGLRAARWCGRR